MPIQFRFHPEKVVEAAATLLKLHGKPMRYLMSSISINLGDAFL